MFTIKMTKIFIAMSIIPSRASNPKFIDNIHHLQKQQITFEKLFISIPKEYKRFPNQTICPKVLQDLESYPWIQIIHLEKDYGPASKFLGPLLNCKETLQDNILIIIDDDRTYSSRMTTLYRDFFVKNPTIHVVSGNPQLYYNVFFYQRLDPQYLDIREARCKYVSGFMSFALHCRHDWSDLEHYTLRVLEKFPNSFYHDEGILMNYFQCFDIVVFYINFKMIEFVQKEMEDSLCESTSNIRKTVEQNILNWTILTYNCKIPNIPKSRLTRFFLLG
jgi:hypothetical protein